MPKWFLPAAVVCALMFAATPIVIAYAPFESTMGLVFKIFFYHMPAAWMFLVSCTQRTSVSSGSVSYMR